MANKSKMVIVAYPRTKKLSKEQLIRQCSITSIMSMMSIGGKIGLSGVLAFQLKDEPGEKPIYAKGSTIENGLPRGWFIGDSQFQLETKRVMKADNYHTLYEWCKRGGVPVFSGEWDGEPSVMAIGPYWSKEIDELFERAIPLKKDIRDFALNCAQKNKK